MYQSRNDTDKNQLDSSHVDKSNGRIDKCIIKWFSVMISLTFN